MRLHWLVSTIRIGLWKLLVQGYMGELVSKDPGVILREVVTSYPLYSSAWQTQVQLYRLLFCLSRLYFSLAYTNTRRKLPTSPEQIRPSPRHNYQCRSINTIAAQFNRNRYFALRQLTSAAQEVTIPAQLRPSPGR